MVPTQNSVGLGKIVVFGALCFFSALPIIFTGIALILSYRHKRNSKTSDSTPTDTTELSPPGDEYKNVIDIWKTSLGVQQHFNDLELRIRNFAVTLLVGVLSAIAFALKEHYVIHFFGFTFSLAVGICLAGIVGVLGFYFMDRYWYHKLLLGSVRQTVSIERKFANKIPEMSLSGAIGAASPLRLRFVEIHSSEKIDIFYSGGLAVLIVLCWALLLGNDPTQEKAINTEQPSTQQFLGAQGFGCTDDKDKKISLKDGKEDSRGEAIQKGRHLRSR